MKVYNLNPTGKFQPHIAKPIILFLIAKLMAYTALGFLLRAVGSVLQLTPTTSALLYIGIGVFMIGNALQMLDVHPIFRYFVIEPPKFLTRYIRRRSKEGESLVTPLFMGTLTIFLPCGVTQAVMAVALGTGSAIEGTLLMFAFILGTIPLFFTVSYFATRLSAMSASIGSQKGPSPAPARLLSRGWIITRSSPRPGGSPWKSPRRLQAQCSIIPVRWECIPASSYLI